ncbi:MAG: hypothetical protein ACLR6B_09400 [Blautia sp.]
MTWILIPPESPGIFTIIMLFFYYSWEPAWNRPGELSVTMFYIFMGMISTVLGAFLLYVILHVVYGGNVVFGSALFSTYYINMSIFLAFALSYPNMQVMLYFFIPIKMKWMGILYGFFIVYSFLKSGWVGKVAIIASLLNFIVFFLMTRDYRRVSPKEIRRKQNFKRQMNTAKPGTADSPCINVLCAGVPNWTETIWSSVTVPNAMEITSIVRIISLPISMSIKNSEVKGL